jgi:phytoene/squalene synthetase
MFRFYRQHYADGRSWLANLAVYAGIAVKLAGSVAASLIRGIRRLRTPRSP